MGEWMPFYISLIILFFVGGILPLFISSFVDVSVYNTDSFVSPIINFMLEGFTFAKIEVFGWTVFDGINFNPFEWFGSSFQDFMISQMSAFSYIPNWASIPLLIFILVGFFYSVIKLLPTT